MQQQQQRRTRTNNRLSLAVTPSFPILISSDIAVIKESAIIQATRSRRSSSVLVADELSPENQSKVLAAGGESPSSLWDRLSLISSTESVTSVFESGDAQPVEQEKICLELSDWLIQTLEERQWRALTESIDFREPVDPSLYLRPSDDDLNGGEESGFSLDYQREEGNSVFYANSTIAGSSYCSLMPSTSSRIYEMSDDLQQPTSSHSSPTLIAASSKSSHSHSRRRLIESDANNELGSPTKSSGTQSRASDLEASPEQQRLVRCGSVQRLICALSDTAAFQNPIKRTELLRTLQNDFAQNLPPISSNRKWRPPKKKFIFELTKANDFLTQLALQKHRCAGCGLNLDRVYAKRAQFCHYFSKLFCQCCHQGAKARIPARILHEWNFKEYPVCDIAQKFLADTEDQPVFNVRLINSALYKKAKNLRRFRKLRLKIAHMWPFVQMCRLAEELMTEHGILRTMFTSVPKRFLSLECVDIFSLLDFERIANRNLLELLEPVVSMGAAHIEGCLYCRQHAFFCQICMDPCDLLFPFQLERCQRCDGCGSLSHTKCYKSALAKQQHGGDGQGQQQQVELACEKCERIRRKKLRLLRNATTSDHSACESE